MQSLAVKYRPATFDDVCEQRSTKLILQEQLKTGTHKNCYLFTGGAGTGKTTCARIFAQDINKGNGSPIEIDAASNNGVDNVRDIIDNAKFKSIDAEYKVYIIDECHMLSTGAWNAMLKLVEEPPAKTVFIFCTTDPQKIPSTILSRVQRFDFRRLSTDSITARLVHILENEGYREKMEKTYDIKAIEYISRLAEGGMRDAITMLDKCLSYSSTINMQNVIEALGVVSYDMMFDLTDYLFNQDKKNIIRTIEDYYRNGFDLKQFIKQYTVFILDVCKYSLFSRDAELSFDYICIPNTYKSRLSKITAPQQVFMQDLLEMMLVLSKDIKWESSPKAMIEASFIVFCDSKE